jgi:hypothetical protein
MTLPNGEKIASRNKQRRDHVQEQYKLICKACGALMTDCEPVQWGGEHWHPKTGCKHDNKPVIIPGWMHPNSGLYGRRRPLRGSTWVAVLRPKKYRRARAQARKIVRKMR